MDAELYVRLTLALDLVFETRLARPRRTPALALTKRLALRRWIRNAIVAGRGLYLRRLRIGVRLGITHVDIRPFVESGLCLP